MELELTKNDENNKIFNCDNDIKIYNTDNSTVHINYKSKDCLQVWVDDQIIYIYPKNGQRNSTDIIFMDKVISSNQ